MTPGGAASSGPRVLLVLSSLAIGVLCIGLAVLTSGAASADASTGADRPAPDARPRRTGDQDPSAGVASAFAPSLVAGARTLAEEAGSRSLRGRVVDRRGEPIAGVGVLLRPGSRPSDAASDRDGRFAMRIPAGLRVASGHFALSDSAWTVLSSTPLGTNPPAGHRIVAVPRLEMQGRVLDPHGAPIPGARIHVAPAPGTRLLGAVADACTWRPRLEGRTDAQGRYRIEEVPSVEGLRARASAEGWAAALAPVQAFLDFRLERPARFHVHGRVRDPSGRPVERATVRFGRRETQTGAEGRFELWASDVLASDALLVLGPSPRLAATHVDAVGRRVLQEESVDIEVVLGAAPRRMELRLVGAAGNALHGWSAALIPGPHRARDRSTDPLALATADDSGAVVWEGSFEACDWSVTLSPPDGPRRFELGPFAWRPTRTLSVPDARPGLPRPFRVVRGDSAPLSGAKAELLEFVGETRIRHRAISDPGGWLRFDDVGEGRRHLRIVAPPRRPWEATFEAGRSPPETLVLRR